MTETASLDLFHRGGALHGVLFSGTVALDSTGRYMASWEVVYAALEVANTSGASVQVTNDPPQVTAPTQGPGTFAVGAGKATVRNLVGRVVTLYGQPNALIGLVVYLTPRPSLYGPTGDSAVTDETTQAQFQRLTLIAGTDTPVTFLFTPRIIRLVNFDTGNQVLFRFAPIVGPTDPAAGQVGAAPVANVPSTRTLPIQTTAALHLFSGGNSQVNVEAYG